MHLKALNNTKNLEEFVCDALYMFRLKLCNIENECYQKRIYCTQFVVCKHLQEYGTCPQLTG